ncbi:MAG TPA: DNA polymerase, partial [Gemmatimonadales bacterium]|nr:DNA polymerase [Gemmatimonadales bacterium]
LQGSAADLIKRAMVAVHRRLGAERLRARMLLQVHDELVLEAPPEEVGAASAVLREEMEGAAELSVPLVVDVGTGGNWLETK